MIVRRAATRPAPVRAAWHTGTVTTAAGRDAAARRIVLDVPTWPGNDAGQHLDVRLTAPDGYQATRSYSLASSGPGTSSSWWWPRSRTARCRRSSSTTCRVGDAVEIHGPLGAFFVWRPPSA